MLNRHCTLCLQYRSDHDTFSLYCDDTGRIVFCSNIPNFRDHATFVINVKAVSQKLTFLVII